MENRPGFPIQNITEIKSGIKAIWMIGYLADPKTFISPKWENVLGPEVASNLK